MPFDPEDAMVNPPLPRRADNTIGYNGQHHQQMQLPPPTHMLPPPQQMGPDVSSLYPSHPLPPVPQRRSKDQRIISPEEEEDVRRLFEECEMAKNNAQVLSHSLTFARPEELGTDQLIVVCYFLFG